MTKKMMSFEFTRKTKHKLTLGPWTLKIHQVLVEKRMKVKNCFVHERDRTIKAHVAPANVQSWHGIFQIDSINDEAPFFSDVFYGVRFQKTC